MLTIYGEGQMEILHTRNAATIKVTGQPFTKEMRLIAALVARLGGDVKLTPEELAAVEGVEVDTEDGGLRLTVG